MEKGGCSGEKGTRMRPQDGNPNGLCGGCHRHGSNGEGRKCYDTGQDHVVQGLACLHDWSAKNQDSKYP